MFQSKLSPQSTIQLKRQELILKSLLINKPKYWWFNETLIPKAMDEMSETYEHYFSLSLFQVIYIYIYGGGKIHLSPINYQYCQEKQSHDINSRNYNIVSLCFTPWANSLKVGWTVKIRLYVVCSHFAPSLSLPLSLSLSLSLAHLTK